MERYFILKNIKDLINYLSTQNLIIENEKNINEIPSYNFSCIVFDTRKITNGSIFFIKGNIKYEFIEIAIKNDIKFFFYDDSFKLDKSLKRSDIFFIKTTNSEKAMALASKFLYDDPFSSLITIGVTGTKGKTTVCKYLSNILNYESNDKAINAGEMFYDSTLTTNESPYLYELAYKAVKNGYKYYILEVSSQSIKRYRIYGIHFKYAIFLNFGIDHISLNEHPTIRDYFENKKKFWHCNCFVIIVCSRIFLLGLF